MSGERETAGLTMRLIVDFVRSDRGQTAVEEMLRLAGETRPLSEIEDEAAWSSYDQKIALFDAAARVTGRTDVARAIGETVLQSSVGTSLRIALGLLGSPPSLLRSVARAYGKFSTVGSMWAEEVTATTGTVVYRIRAEYALSRYDCDYTVGLLTQVPVLFGLPPASIEHRQCQVRGDSQCVYHLRWQRRSRLPWARRTPSVTADALLGRLHQLQATLSELVASSDVDDVLDAIASRAGSAVNAERFLLAARLFDGEAPRVRSDGFAAGQDAALAEDLLAGRRVKLEGHHMLTAEVRTSRRVYGRLAAFARYEFLDHEADLLESFAGLAATALEAVTAVAEADDRRRTAEALLGLASRLHTAPTRGEISAAVADAARTVVAADVATTLLFDIDRRALHVSGHSGWPPGLIPLLSEVRISVEDTGELAELLANPDAPRIYRDDCQDPFLRQLLQQFGTRQIGVVSVGGTTDVHGILIAGWSRESAAPALSAALFERMKALAGQATNALDKADLMEHVHRQATSDPLTGIANRRVLSDRLELVMDQPAPERQSALLFIDLDGFKEVNDRLGHAAGDELLQTVADRLRSGVRAEDLVARLGGDEFTVLLASVPGPQAALEVADHLMAALGRRMVVGGQAVDIHCSIGVVMIDPGERSASEVLSAADAAMYGAKKSGGNCSALWSRPACDRPSDPGRPPSALRSDRQRADPELGCRWETGVLGRPL